MLKILYYLIHGELPPPKCTHNWELKQSMKYYSDSHEYLYICDKCGKMKKTKLGV